MRKTDEIAKLLKEINQEYRDRLDRIYDLLQGIQTQYSTYGFIFPKETVESKIMRNNKYKAEALSIWSAKDEQKFMDHANKILEEVYKLEKHTYEKNG